VAVSGILAFSVATNDQKGNSYHSLPVRVTRAVAEVESYRPKLELVEVSQVFATGTDSVVTALQPIDLAVPPGKFVSIIGPSGCGKSTLFNIIAGLQRPTAGDVLLDGQVVTRMIGLVGYMLQKDLLLPWRTVLDNVILGMELKGVAKTTARARALPYLKRYGLAGFDRHYPAALSGGMRQRAALLRTLLYDTEVVLLDEPFGALDALTRERMGAELLRIWEARKKTVVMVTHSIPEALLLADRVLVLSPRPGQVRLTVENHLPRPRRMDMEYSPEFGALAAQVRGAIA